MPSQGTVAYWVVLVVVGLPAFALAVLCLGGIQFVVIKALVQRRVSKKEFDKGQVGQVSSKPRPIAPLPLHAFCENVAAGSTSPWHIRTLTEEGKKTSGGADTPAMCGHVVHWDRQYPVSRATVFLLDKGQQVCQKCSTLYMEDTKL